MIAKIFGGIAELLAIAFAFFVVGMLLAITGVGIKLYGVERAQGTYMVEFFLGMACSAAFIQTVAFGSNGSIGALVAGALLSPIICYFAFLVSMWVVGIQEVLIVSTIGKQSEVLGLLFVMILFLACFVSVILFQKVSLNLDKRVWKYALVSCVLGAVGVVYLAPNIANKMIIVTCFSFGFVVYFLVRLGLGGGLCSSIEKST